MIKFKIILIVIVFTGLLSGSCNRHMAHQKEEKTYYYDCPIHQDYISYQPGKCPKCGMVLEQWEMDKTAKNSGNTKYKYNNFGNQTGGCH